MMITGDQRLLKRINRMALVRLVRSQPGLSRAELSAATGLTKSTVSLLAQELIDDGWLREDAVVVTGAIGRRPTPLLLDDQHLALIGAELGVGTLCVVAMSLNGEILLREEADFALDKAPVVVVGDLARILSRVVTAVRAMNRDVLGIGVGVPGAMQTNTGMLVVAPNLGWRQEPLCEMLQRALAEQDIDDFPLFVQNDGDVAALGEVEFSASPVPDPLLFLSLGVGVGSGMVVGGRLLLGGRGFAGEVGHIQLQAGGPRCSCGRTGCAEALFGMRALARSLNCSLEDLIAGAQAEEATTLARLKVAGEQLGAVLHNLWMMLDPAQIVLGGPARQLGPAFFDTARATFAKMARAAGLEIPPVVDSRFAELSVPVGAAAVVLHKLLQPM